MSEIRKDFEALKNSLGFYSNKPAGSSGNDLLFSAEAVLVLANKNEWGQADHEALLAAIRKHAQIKPGLFGRPGWMQDQQQLDDYIGLCVIDRALAAEILSYGRSHWWIFRTSDRAGWYEPLFFRWPAFMAHVVWSAGEKPSAFLRLAWFVSVAFSGSERDLDSWKLNYLLIHSAGNGGLPEQLASAIWWTRLKRNFGSMAEVYGRYFGKGDPRAVYCLD